MRVDRPMRVAREGEPSFTCSACGIETRRAHACDLCQALLCARCSISTGWSGGIRCASHASGQTLGDLIAAGGDQRPSSGMRSAGSGTVPAPTMSPSRAAEDPEEQRPLSGPQEAT